MNKQMLLVVLLIFTADWMAAQKPVEVGDVLIGTCDGIVIDTQFGATEVLTPTGDGVNEFDANDGVNLCMMGMMFDTSEQPGTSLTL